MWQKYDMIYNLGKFKMDKNLLGVGDAELEPSTRDGTQKSRILGLEQEATFLTSQKYRSQYDVEDENPQRITYNALEN